MNKKRKPLISIIIPLYIASDRFFSDLHFFSRLNYPSYEILIVTDSKIEKPNVPFVRIIQTKRLHTGPAEKRDIGLQKSKGDFCAFIDDDAYPDSHWLSNSIKEFYEDTDIVAVGGPGITPANESFFSRLGGLVYESPLTSGKAQHRFVSQGQEKQYIQDWPAYNLIVRKDILKKVGGYGCTFYGGEDTFLCLKLIRYGKILYDPSVKVFHHRRPLFLPHLRQIYNIGVHRGYFFKKFPETSRKMFYVLPTLLTIGFFSSCIFSVVYPFFLPFFLITFFLFFLLAFFTVFTKTIVVGAFIATIGILLTHIAYGLGFLDGLFTEHLVR